MRILVICLVLLATLAIAGSPFKPIDGSYYISSAPIHDAIDPLPLDTHLYLSIKGEAAKKSYHAMKIPPQESLCGENHLEKKSGEFSCSFYPKTDKYLCSFSVDVNHGKLDSIGSC